MDLPANIRETNTDVVDLFMIAVVLKYLDKVGTLIKNADKISDTLEYIVKKVLKGSDEVVSFAKSTLVAIKFICKYIKDIEV